MLRSRIICFPIILMAACASQDAPEATNTSESDPVVAQLMEAAAADTTSWQAQVALSAELRRKQRYEEAAQAANQAFMLAPGDAVEARLEMAKVYAASDRSAAAINVVKAMEKKKRAGTPVDEIKIAEVYAVLGDTAAVFRWVERGVTANSPNLATLNTNPEFTGYQNHPRWQDLLVDLPAS